MAQEKLYEIAVNAATQYLADQSDESAGRYVFAYTITIHNTGSVPAQLISRHWISTDAQGVVQEVRGLGVVGAQPAMKARRLGSSCARPQPGRSEKPLGSYRAVSGAGFGGRQTGHGAQPATRRIRTAQRMWIIYLEIALALAIAAFIVWFTWPRKRK